MVKFSADKGGAVPDSAPIETSFVPRRVYLKPADLSGENGHGYTAGCPGCLYLQIGMGGRRNHTAEGRTRIEARLAETEPGKERLKTAEERQALLIDRGQEVGRGDAKEQTNNERDQDHEETADKEVTKEERAQLEEADPSVRSAILGKGHEREETNPSAE